MESKLSFRHINACIEKGISFAAYSLPSYNTFEFILPENIYSFNDLSEVDKKSGFIFHPFSIKESKILFLECEDSINQGQNCESLNELILSQPKIKNAPKCEPSTTKESYSDSFDVSIEKLKDLIFSKIVLSRIQFKETKVDPVFLFEKLVMTYPNNFNYIFFNEESGCWLGSSPEVLYAEKGNMAKTVALAGTQAINALSSYNWGEKEIEEQRIVVEYIMDILEKHINTEIRRTDETIEAAQVAHLKSIFSFPKKEISNITSLIKDLHPTPAVCGLPKSEAQIFIESIEKHDRAYYSGFLGPYNLKEQSNLFVNLRCLKACSDGMNLFIGGGITQLSDKESEWRETELKAKTLLSIIEEIEDGSI